MAGDRWTRGLELGIPWLAGHITTKDRAFAEFVSARGL